MPSDIATAPQTIADPEAGTIESAGQNDQLLARQISAEVGKRQSEAQRLLEEEPTRAMEILREAQKLGFAAAVTGPLGAGDRAAGIAAQEFSELAELIGRIAARGQRRPSDDHRGEAAE